MLPCLGWCSYSLLGIVRWAAKTDMQDCWPFTCCLSWTFDLSLQCIQLKFFIFEGSLLIILIDSIFVIIRRCYKNVSVRSFFRRSARCRTFLPIVCFPSTYDLSVFKSRIKRQLLTVGNIFNLDFTQYKAELPLQCVE